MTIPFLVDDLKTDEGYAKALPDGRCEAYPDPKFGGAPWTIGYGCTGPGIGPGTIWTKVQAETELQRRCQQVETQLDHAFPWWRGMNRARQAVLANMAFNLGLPRLMGFTRMLDALKADDYAAAADQMLASQWRTDVGKRAERLAAEMRNGSRSATPSSTAPATLAEASRTLYGQA